MILVHGHANNDLNPTSEDKELTKGIIEAGDIVKIRVVEHLIISEKEYLSFADDDLL